MPAYSHIVIACSYLHVPGGYEKAMITTANLFAEKGHKVTLLILDHTPGTYYPVHPGVNIVQHYLNFGITDKGNTISRKLRLWKDIRKLKSILEDLVPDQLICSEYPFAVSAILAGAKRSAKVFSWEHHHYKAQHLNKFWQYLLKRTYKKLDAVVCLNPDEREYYKGLNENATVIPNFIAPVVATATTPAKNIHLISVTRFNPIKGIDLLMNVAKIILPAHRQIKWKVIGYGDQKDMFLDFIEREGLFAQLLYQPADKTDLTKDYQASSVFVMTSRNECFPLVLLEAMNNGLPCIAFDCDTGPRHIISNETGLLVEKENTEKMAASILSLLYDRQKMETMSMHARKAVEAYYPDKVYALWNRLFS